MKQTKQIRVWIARDSIQSVGDTVVFKTKPIKFMLKDVSTIMEDEFEDSFYYNLNNGKTSYENGLAIPNIGLKSGELRRAVITLEDNK